MTNQTPIWDHECECMPREELEKLQLDRLKNTVSHAFENVPAYREKWRAEGFEPTDLKDLEQLGKLPFTTKEDLRNNYPFGMLAVDMDEIARIHASSGTTGNPTVVCYTPKDLDTWAELIARVASAAGVTRSDVVQITFGYGLFTGGFGLHYGIEKIGAAIVPASSGNAKRQIKLMKDFGTTALVGTPSYSLRLAEVMEAEGVNPGQLKLKRALFGAEPWSEAMRTKIEEALKIDTYDNYGLSEIMGPGVSAECIEKNGMHIFEDHFIVETIDPETGEVLQPGSTGELVFTTLTKEALPIIRYRTHDISRIITEPCSCGRTSHRMERVTGRSDDMLIIRGVNIFPSQIETALLELEHIKPHYQLVITRPGAMDEIEVRVEVSDALFNDEMKVLAQTQRRLEKHLRNFLGISLKLTLVEPGSIERSQGKAKRIVDMRNI